ncbi:hypothetical protein TFLX_05593 [Thermoflexales bacterium]|nr:hypothetical protein TFLX_05593 [Thermoflexales bacterium]
MNAHLTDQQLNAYLHQTLNDAQRETLDAHLANCPVCRARLSELAVLQQRLRRELAAELKAVNVPLSLTFEMIAPKLQPQSRAIRLWHHSRQTLLGLTAVAALLMVVIVLANTVSPTAEQIGGRLISNAGRVGGWYIDGDDPASYEFGIDQSVAYTGQASGFIRAKADVPKGTGALMQGTSADSYRGKRIRLSAYIKTEEVERQAGLWLRINRSQIQTLRFADMNNRPIQGTTDWQKYDLVLDVPAEATHISFAFFLMGRGQAWVDDVQLEVVGQEVATTEAKEDPPLAQPTNLDFEAGLDGWLPERNPQNYTTSIDTVNVHGGQASAHIQPKQANPISYAVLVQSVKAEAYRGKRLRVTAYLKFEKVDATAQLVTGAFDAKNIKQQESKKSIDATAPWQKQSLVFKVPDNSDRIVLGVVLQGEGQIWMDDVQVEVVGTDVPLTSPEQVPDIAAQPSVPTGQDLDQSFSDWVIAGTRPQDYEMGFDSEVVHTGKSSAYVKSVASAVPEFGTFMTMVDAANYRGKRVRLAALVKAERVEGQARLWLRVDGPESAVLGFDNMQNRPIQGTHDWQKYEVVLDVPENSVDLAYGILVAGKGQVWLDDVRLQVVDQSVPITGYETKPPADLGFEIDDHSWAAPAENTAPTPAPTTPALISVTATPPAIEDISAVQFGGVATLVKPHLVQEKFLPGEAVPLTLDWTILIKFNQTYTSFAHVLDSQGNVVAQADLPLQVAALIDSIPASTGWNTPQGHITLPADLSPGQYKIAIGIYSNQTGQRLTTDQGETTTVMSTIEVVTPLARFGNTVALTDVELPVAKPAAGELLELSLHWLVSITNPLTLNTFVHVIDSQGNLATQADQALAPAETSVQTITLQLPTAMGTGDYQIVVGVYDTTTLSRLTTDKGDTTATIGMVAIGVPPTRFGDVVTLADASLLMIGPAPSAAVELSLHWTISATNPTTLTTFVHVVDPQGNLIAQSDQPLTDRETSIQTITLQLPATLSSGTYQVVVGVYDTTTFLRLMTDVGETQIPLTSFQLKSK